MDGKYICPYNSECRCTELNCEKCGWNPKVAEERKKEFMDLKSYKIPFTGYCEVWAKSPEEAAAKADNGEMFYADYDFGDPIREKNLVEEEEDAMD
jgi:hypothetical protein